MDPRFKTHNGKLHIALPMGGDPDDECFTIELVDETSGVQVFEARVPVADFARALATRQVDCRYQLRFPEAVGYLRETKTEKVPVIGDAATSLAPFEVDGWSARSGDFGNRHRSASGERDLYAVVFSRLVHPVTKEPLIR